MIWPRKNFCSRSKEQTVCSAKARGCQLQKPNPTFLTTFSVKGPQEATLDSHLLLMASNVGAQKARAMKSGSGAFDVDEFLSKLVNFLKDRKGPEDAFSEDSDGEDYGGHIVPLDWDRIGRKAMAKSCRVPMMDFMSASTYSFVSNKLIHNQARAIVYRTKETSPKQTC